MFPRQSLQNTKCSGFSPGLVEVELGIGVELRVGLELVGLVVCMGFVTSTGLG